MNTCEKHKNQECTVGCLCIDDHCPVCEHPVNGMEAEFLKFMEELKKK